MKVELEQRRDLLTAMESDLAKAEHFNGQISASFHKCDVDLSRYADLVGQVTDRWRRIQTQIDSRYVDVLSLMLLTSFRRTQNTPPPHTLSSAESGTWRSRRNS